MTNVELVMFKVVEGAPNRGGVSIRDEFLYGKKERSKYE